jgi:hypothetical protein
LQVIRIKRIGELQAKGSSFIMRSSSQMDETEFKIELTSQADPEHIQQIWAGLREFNLLHAPPPNHTSLVITILDGQGGSLAGWTAAPPGTGCMWTHYGCGRSCAGGVMEKD